VVVSGIAVSTLLTMFILPGLLQVFLRERRTANERKPASLALPQLPE
jgi:predicted Na+-dependent transporter